MYKTAVMDIQFERNKNLKALAITIIVCVAIFFIFFYIRWGMPVIEKPLFAEGIEVNIGNSDVGSGNVQPLVPGEPAPETNPQDNSTPPPSQPNTTPAASENTENPEPDAVPTTTSTPNKTATNNTSTTKNNKPTTTTTIPTPKPKVVMPKYSGGNGTGGNNASDYNDSRNQGDDISGNGDKGKPWGSIDGKAYDGPGGTKIYGLGRRKITSFPTFTDDFDENAKVAVDIIVDKSGRVTFTRVNPVGTSTTNKKTRAVAERRARDIKFEPSNEEQRGTIILDMRVTG